MSDEFLAKGMISVSMAELDAMQERWEQRLANQKQVIDNLQAALDAERQSAETWRMRALAAGYTES